MRPLRRLSRPEVALPVVSAVALLARLFELGARVAHQDEARVADWILHYMAVGAWQYRAIIHGPFIPHVDGVVFSILGPSDFTMRLVVAVVGGLLPLAAWLFRTRLRDTEVIALGLVLAANPVLVYYSRFLRNDLLLAAFALTAVGFTVRAMDTGRERYLLVAAGFFGLATTTKENVLLYPVAWLGAAVLLFDYRLFRARYADDDWLAVATAELLADGRALWRWKLPILVGIAEVVAIFVVFYAPLPDLFVAFGNPALLPGVVHQATVGTANEFLDLWGSTHMQQHSYVGFLAHLLKVVAAGGATTVTFAAVGFVGDRYGGDREPRDLVAFAFYWGVASLFGYPIVSDIKAPWTAVHVLAPLAIPAAVGLAMVYGRLRGAIAAEERPTAAVAAVLLVLAFTASVGGTVATSYVAPQSPTNPLVQYAQPSGKMKPTLAEIRAISEANPGVDITFYGGEFVNANDRTTVPTLEIGVGGYQGWFARLPLPWYFDQYGARVTSTSQASTLQSDPPPVVITLQKNADEVAPYLQGYDRVTYQGYLWGRPIVFFVKKDAPRRRS